MPTTHRVLQALLALEPAQLGAKALRRPTAEQPERCLCLLVPSLSCVPRELCTPLGCERASALVRHRFPLPSRQDAADERGDTALGGAHAAKQLRVAPRLSPVPGQKPLLSNLARRRLEPGARAHPGKHGDVHVLGLARGRRRSCRGAGQLNGVLVGRRTRCVVVVQASDDAGRAERLVQPRPLRHNRPVQL
jgi:hypothetical protein